MNLRRALLLALLGALALATMPAPHATSQPSHRPPRAPVPNDAPPAPPNETACNYQAPQDFLIRENFVLRFRMSDEEQAAHREAAERAIRYRTEHYGYFEGFGRHEWNAHTPSDNATRARFMDLPIQVNAQLLPALACVEEQLRTECASTGYQPRRLSGLRTRNTYHNGEVSNHVYGIAVDVDPTENTCCMCVAQWGDHPLCQREVESIYERMAMPACWVHVFERFGFYWLGHDALQDTMHFEFLGDSEHILKSDGPPPVAAPAAPEQTHAAPEAAPAADHAATPTARR